MNASRRSALDVARNLKTCGASPSRAFSWPRMPFQAIAVEPLVELLNNGTVGVKKFLWLCGLLIIDNARLILTNGLDP